jgi:antirestriction protein
MAEDTMTTSTYDLNVYYDYADPMLDAQRLLRECHEALIDKSDLDAAADAARDLRRTAAAIETAIIYQQMKARSKRWPA